VRAEWDRLLVAARGGDGQALGSLLEVAHEDLHAAAAGVVRHALRGDHPLDDVYGDAMLAVVREIHSLRATNYVGFRYWFASIARNHLRRMLRRARARPGQHGVDELPEREVRLPILPARECAFVRNALERLPRSQQVAFVLRGGLALTWTTIGFVIERRAPPAARLMHYRALGRVKELALTRPDVRALAPAILS
jgi:RNA polymerase sigma factor (sigma-70 family)